MMKHDIVIETPGWHHNNIHLGSLLEQCGVPVHQVTLAEMLRLVPGVIVGEPSASKL